MGMEENKEVVRKFIAYSNKWDTHKVDEITTENLIMHNVHGGGSLDREGIKQSNIYIHIPYPNQSLILEDIVAEGDKVAVRTTFRGKQDGKFRNIEPTGRDVEISRFVIFRLENGKIAEAWFLSDSLASYQQLGVLPRDEEIGK